MIAFNHSPQFDFILVGGGLQSGLLALALKHHQPECRVLLIERDEKIAGNHTWSFHPGDVPASCLEWASPLVQYQWDGYEVNVGDLRRCVDLTYASVCSEHFSNAIGRLFAKPSWTYQSSRHFVEMAVASGGAALPKKLPDLKPSNQHASDTTGIAWELLTDTHVSEITEHSVSTRSGQTFVGDVVIDCRGPSGNLPFSGCGFQKFFGFEILVGEDWPHERPVIMKDVEDQRDGFRFLYTLPLSNRRVLVEDTRFSDTPACDRDECLRSVTRYVNDLGIREFQIVREESGVLPMPFTSECLPTTHSPLSGGYAGGWFHAATGYSFPLAVAFAEAVASGPRTSAKARVDLLAKQHRWRSHYSRFLNRLLFRLVAPAKRYRIFRRFYRVLDDQAIERFYSHRFTAADAFRIIVGIPPTLVGLRPFRFIHSFFSGAN